MDNKQFDGLFNKAKELMNRSKDPVHDWHHIERVLVNIDKILRRLPAKVVEGLDMRILKLGAAWHDISFVFHRHNFWHYLVEGKEGARIARKYFKEVDLAKREIRLICSVVWMHQHSSFFILNKRHSLYHQIVQDADTMDTYNSPIRLKLVEEQVKQSSFYYKFLMKVLKPLFFNWISKSSKIYNLKESVKIVRGKYN